MNKVIGTILIIVALGIGGGLIVSTMFASNEYTNAIGNYWTLADRASTVSQKSDYIDKFVTALQESGLQGTYDTIFFPTPENSFDSNLQALKSLQSRLHDIKSMDESSFAYQTAIQQITAQEQGQADDMLSVFGGSWWKVHHYFLWNGLIGLGMILIIIIVALCGLVSFNWD